MSLPSIYPPTDLLIDQSINQSINQSTHRSIIVHTPKDSRTHTKTEEKKPHRYTSSMELLRSPKGGTGRLTAKRALRSKTGA